MKSSPRLLAGSAALLLILALVFTAPASLLGSWLGKRGIQGRQWTGSLWSGEATQLRVGPLALTSLQWHTQISGFFRGQLQLEVKGQLADAIVS